MQFETAYFLSIPLLKEYYQNRVEAEQRPKKYLSLIVDGMDQAKTNIPHFTGISIVYT